ncbi:MAG: glutamate formimidoyltransferase [Chitinophagales bacterium]|nr:glutamate formimidoyltransferase [Chitinophagales bacterium]MDW8428465.1 glutamate formimidoyltransferase [Chitinophagales bacterium]
MGQPKALVECVPNFSEGRDPNKIKFITDAISSVEGVHLLDVDSGRDTNRTVVTFVGPPEAVAEAAFRGIQAAKQVIDMRHHKGAHPRMGATDVCPFVPISGITMEETAALARRVGERVGKELAIPVYLYEHAQPDPRRKSLSVIRAGEYEGFFEKIKLPEWKPDYGPDELPPQSGATVIGARNFLVAFNVNLNTTSVRRANAIAFDVREAGRKVLNEKGEYVHQPGWLKAVKAIGWYLKEHGIAQVSMNLTDLSVTPVHVAFDACVRSAADRGLRVTGSELVGLIPLQAMLDAGRYFLHKQRRSSGLSEKELIAIAVRSMGLNELYPFEPQKKIIEYRLREVTATPLAHMSLGAFTEEVARESPAPGGGSVAALLGSLAASLGTMVANLTAHKRDFEHNWKWYSDWAEKGQHLRQALLLLVDDDTKAFNQLLSSHGMAKTTEAEALARSKAIQEATQQAIEIPLRVMQLCNDTLDLLQNMMEKGNPNSISDVGVGVCCARAAAEGAALNVRINLPGLTDAALREQYAQHADKLQQEIRQRAEELLDRIQQFLTSTPTAP